MGWHTAGSEKSRKVLIRKYFAVVPRIHHRFLTGIGLLKKIEDAKCIRLISISTIDFGYGAKVPRPSRRISRKKCRQVMAWVGTVQALLRETNFDAPYLVNALKSVGEPVTGRRVIRRPTSILHRNYHVWNRNAIEQTFTFTYMLFQYVHSSSSSSKWQTKREFLELLSNYESFLWIVAHLLFTHDSCRFFPF